MFAGSGGGEVCARNEGRTARGRQEEGVGSTQEKTHRHLRGGRGVGRGVPSGGDAKRPTRNKKCESVRKTECSYATSPARADLSHPAEKNFRPLQAPQDTPKGSSERWRTPEATGCVRTQKLKPHFSETQTLLFNKLPQKKQKCSRRRRAKPSIPPCLARQGASGTAETSKLKTHYPDPK